MEELDGEVLIEREPTADGESSVLGRSLNQQER